MRKTQVRKMGHFSKWICSEIINFVIAYFFRKNIKTSFYTSRIFKAFSYITSNAPGD